jgi:nucleoside-diphosphate-sugar epimerase
MTTIAITGASGFIGQKLILEHLALGHNVRILTRSANATVPEGVEVCIGSLDMNDLPPSFPGKADVLYHCAAELRDPAKMKSVNIDGTNCLISAAKEKVSRWVQLSSVGIYGPQSTGSINEESIPAPKNLYEQTKLASDISVIHASEAGNFDFSILRPSNVFGPTMINQSLFGLISAINSGKFFFIGPHGASANYVHADNVVKGLVLCGLHQRASGNIFNLSDHRTLEDFVDVICANLGVSSPRFRLPKQIAMFVAKGMNKLTSNFPLSPSRVDMLTTRCVYPSIKIERELSYKHALTMEEGLDDTIHHWKHMHV